ncbi:MAG: response regulator transcription factor [Armatimonadota bacterium]|nr:response regulator transcription factor [Armatimonadota bacterium]MDR7427331.1 response regulator transcription factor [Armatimonadota bacterium]MDR7464888.1 response regulator transcription factor [Armatimonadota bacterium]MDR7470922.1 response regulator transcription factor [Armatimonadota bacterium]MDR7474638.1 response regulator transcription factor [Armatimonadota bacterium]
MKETRVVRVLLADHLALIRHGIRALLSLVEDVEIVGEVATANELLRVAKEVEPDVILLDQDLPGDSLQATRAVKEAMPAIEIIIMTDRLDDVKALQAIEAGATGYILKDIPVANLAAALRAVCNGRAFFHPEITRKMIERLVRLTREQRSRLHLESEGLTARELDILIELAKGSTDREIAAKFVVAEGTVKTHIRHILRKLGVRNRTQAVAYVLRRGLIQ